MGSGAVGGLNKRRIRLEAQACGKAWWEASGRVPERQRGAMAAFVYRLLETRGADHVLCAGREQEGPIVVGAHRSGRNLRRVASSSMSS